MHDFYAPSAALPLDQADGLRRMFAGRRTRLVPLVANPHVPFCSLALDRVAIALAAAGYPVLVVDASLSAPRPSELARLDLAAGIEPLSAQLGYLPARGLPIEYVNTRGCAAGFVQALQEACPQAEVIVLQAEAADLARVLKNCAARPVLLGADHPESLKHAYGSAKLLAQRCGLMSFDLLLAAPAFSPRVAAIASSLNGCLEQFLGAALCHSALVDPGQDQEPTLAALQTLLRAQLNLDAQDWAGASTGLVAPPSSGWTSRHAAAPAQGFSISTAFR